MAGTGRAEERSAATGSPASDSSKRPVFTPTVVACVVCPGKLHAFAENAKFHLPLSDITDSWNPRIGRRISQGSARETTRRDMYQETDCKESTCATVGASPKPPAQGEKGRPRAPAEAASTGGISSSQKPRFLGLPAA